MLARMNFNRSLGRPWKRRLSWSRRAPLPEVPAQPAARRSNTRYRHRPELRGAGGEFAGGASGRLAGQDAIAARADCAGTVDGADAERPCMNITRRHAVAALAPARRGQNAAGYAGSPRAGGASNRRTGRARQGYRAGCDAGVAADAGREGADFAGKTQREGGETTQAVAVKAYEVGQRHGR